MQNPDFFDIAKAMQQIALNDEEKIRSLLIRKGCSSRVAILQGRGEPLVLTLIAPIDEETISQIKAICPRVSIEHNYWDAGLD